MPSSKIYGLIGYPVKHSLSPSMHNAAFQALSIPAEYRLFEVKPEELKGFLSGDISIKDTKGDSFLSEEIVGFNITIPHKVPAFVDVKDKTGRIGPDYSVLMTGAINTVKRAGQTLICVNTDVKGFMDSLREDLKFNPENKTALVFGCGGAGRAVIAGLLPQEGFKIKKIYIYDSNQEAVTSAKKQFSVAIFEDKKDKIEFLVSLEDISEKINEFDLLVNATPIGMREGDASVVDKKLLRRGLFVYDVIYNRETQLVKDARSLGLASRGGLGMLLYQGIAAFLFWFPERAKDKTEIEKAMRKALNEGASG